MLTSPLDELLPIGLVTVVAAVACRIGMPVSTALVVRRPNLLVPGAMAFTVSLLLLNMAPGGGGAFVHDNPFGIGRPGTAAGASPVGWILLPIHALLIAGLIGLAERSEDPQVRGSQAFTQGLFRHGLPILVAKTCLVLTHLTLSLLVSPRSIGLLVFLLPSVVVAPILGAVTRHPKRTLKALQSGFGRGLEDPGSIAGPVVALVGFLFAVSVIAARTGTEVTETEALPAVVSILSFHSTALCCAGFATASSVFASLAATFVSTVALLECWRNTSGASSQAESAPSDQVV